MDARPDLESIFPNLRLHSYRIASPTNKDYNCVAHSAGSSDAWWWPVPEGTKRVYWPPGLAREATLIVFVTAFATLGYVACDGPYLEAGFEKVAIYADANGAPTHAARQLPSGVWTSKLGRSVDIDHDAVEALEGETYGKAVSFLRRPRQN